MHHVKNFAKIPSMPIIKSAKKKMRQDKKREARNREKEINLKKLIKNMRKNPNSKLLQEVTSVLDKAVKTNLIHFNKASRLKSRLSKLVVKGTQKKSPKKAI